VSCYCWKTERGIEHVCELAADAADLRARLAAAENLAADRLESLEGCIPIAQWAAHVAALTRRAEVAEAEAARLKQALYAVRVRISKWRAGADGRPTPAVMHEDIDAIARAALAPRGGDEKKPP
jgi:hypothetical protein